MSVSLLLFIATPSKWPWHFGALIGVACLACAAETVRWRGETGPSITVRLRTIVALSALIVAALWSWSPRGAWNAVDLRTLDWTPSFERLVPLTSAAALPLALVVAGIVVSRLRQAQLQTYVPRRLVDCPDPRAAARRLHAQILVADGIRTAEWTALGRTSQH